MLQATVSDQGACWGIIRGDKHDTFDEKLKQRVKRNQKCCQQARHNPLAKVLNSTIHLPLVLLQISSHPYCQMFLGWDNSSKKPIAILVIGIDPPSRSPTRSRKLSQWRQPRTSTPVNKALSSLVKCKIACHWKGLRDAILKQTVCKDSSASASVCLPANSAAHDNFTIHYVG